MLLLVSIGSLRLFRAIQGHKSCQGLVLLSSDAKRKQTGHNRSTCERRNAAASSGTVGVQSAASPNAMAVVSNTQQSCTSSRKRKAPAGSSHGASVKNVTKTSARGVNYSGCSATGKASAHVSASATKITRPDPKQGPMLLLPPWESAKP